MVQLHGYERRCVVGVWKKGEDKRQWEKAESGGRRRNKRGKEVEKGKDRMRGKEEKRGCGGRKSRGNGKDGEREGIR